MSIGWMSQVWEHSQAKGSDLLLLLAIADYADEKGSCYPGIERLAERIRMSPRAVRYCLDCLEETGELTVIRETGKVNRYQLSAAKFAPPTAKFARVTPAKSEPKLQGTPAIAIAADPSMIRPDPSNPAESSGRASAREAQTADELFGVRESMPEGHSPLYTLQELGFELGEDDYAWALADLEPAPSREWIANATKDFLDFRNLPGCREERDTPMGWDARWRADLRRKVAARWGMSRNHAPTAEPPRHALLELRA